MLRTIRLRWLPVTADQRVNQEEFLGIGTRLRISSGFFRQMRPSCSLGGRFVSVMISMREWCGNSAVTSYGRTSGYFVSAQEYAELQRLRALERRAYRLSELPVEVADAIEASKMNPAHDHLNDLLKEQK